MKETIKKPEEEIINDENFLKELEKEKAKGKEVITMDINDLFGAHSGIEVVPVNVENVDSLNLNAAIKKG